MTRKLYLWETTDVIEIETEFAEFIWNWDTELSTDPNRWGGFFDDESKKELDFCMNLATYDYWCDAFRTVTKNVDKIQELSDEEYLNLELDQLVSYLKGGDNMRKCNCGESLADDPAISRYSDELLCNSCAEQEALANLFNH